MSSARARVATMLIASLALFVGCDATGDPATSGPENAGEQGHSRIGHLTIEPRVELEGVKDVFAALDITQLTFDAELFVIPDSIDEGADGDAVAVRVHLDEDGAHTELLGRALDLSGAGRYRVLLRVRPAPDGASVKLDGSYVAPVIERNKADEPAPSPADTDEPAPSPADEPAPSPAEPAPSPAEPAPSPADEPAPSPADEPAPSPARGGEDEEPAPSPARGKPDQVVSAGVDNDSGASVKIISNEAFEFYAGTVDITGETDELVVTWDVRTWLRSLLSEALGIDVPTPETEVAPEAPRAGFQDTPADFRIDAR